VTEGILLEVVESLRRVVCALPECARVFFLCSRCDRGNRYCSVACRASARCVSQRAARRRHQATETGLQDHRDRNRAYRARRRVTDHPTGLRPARRSLPSPSEPPAHGTQTEHDASAFILVTAFAADRPPRCERCGRRGRVLRNELLAGAPLRWRRRARDP
jgi:hypothetical protein